MSSEDTVAKQLPLPHPQSEGQQEPSDRLALMRELEASLARSRQALVTLDLGGIGQGTREQWGLSRRLAEEQRRGSLQRRSFERRSLPPAGAEELARSENGVVQALRLQLALLARAQRKLRVLENHLAGTAVNYGSLLQRCARAPLLPARKREEWI